ncbi:hypothetical protein CEXT_585501 [Caerostris extrusa]|uniref:HNH homing endonuclease n=1 Tax=Caerostris extrusa TaxID=172846 RepID=A0AAV4PIK3_CAEEX|nr:hypothetical protein CEXT_585501 [Caerostris extrusa]
MLKNHPKLILSGKIDSTGTVHHIFTNSRGHEPSHYCLMKCSWGYNGFLPTEILHHLIVVKEWYRVEEVKQGKGDGNLAFLVRDVTNNYTDNTPLIQFGNKYKFEEDQCIMHHHPNQKTNQLI